MSADGSFCIVRIPGPPAIAVEVSGEGPLVLFLHGVGGNRTNWRDQMVALAGDFRVAAWDMRGYGASEDGPPEPAIADYAADVVRVLDGLGAQRAHLVGLSMGGIIAQDVCARWPDRCLSLVLADTARGRRSPASDAWVEEFLAARRAPLLAGRTPEEIAPNLAETLLGPGAGEEARTRIVASLAAVRPSGYIAALEAVTRHVTAVDHGTIGIPVLVLCGAEDRLTPPREAGRLAEAIPGARLTIIEGAGHVSNIERPDAFNSALAAFLQSI